MLTEIVMRPFTKEDWYGLAGCERFDDGSEPLIGYVSVTEWVAEDTEWFATALDAKDFRVMIVHDRNGIALCGQDVMIGVELNRVKATELIAIISRLTAAGLRSSDIVRLFLLVGPATVFGNIGCYDPRTKPAAHRSIA